MPQDPEYWDEIEPVFLQLISRLVDGVIIENSNDLKQCSSRCLLQIADALPDEYLPVFVGLLKRVDTKHSLFHKLMGEHEQDNLELVDRFFHRYREIVLQAHDDDFNPLLIYLPPSSFGDLVFIQSRESFFKRQTMEHIKEFLFRCFGVRLHFNALQHDEAWNWFWNRIMEGGDGHFAEDES
jgi:hypothetical protein